MIRIDLSDDTMRDMVDLYINERTDPDHLFYQWFEDRCKVRYQYEENEFGDTYHYVDVENEEEAIMFKLRCL